MARNTLSKRDMKIEKKELPKSKRKGTKRAKKQVVTGRGA